MAKKKKTAKEIKFEQDEVMESRALLAMMVAYRYNVYYG